MNVGEAIKILEKANPDLPIFICLDIDSNSYLRNPSQVSPIVILEGLINYNSYIGVIPFTPLEIQCLT